MRKHLLAGLVLSMLLIAGGGAAQQFPAVGEKPVWTMEIIRAKPGMFNSTLGYLDDDWMRVREEGRRQGVVMSYHRIAEQGSGEGDRNIVLLTEFKNLGAYAGREGLFASIRKQLPTKTAGIMRLHRQEDLYETVSTRVFQDYSEMDNERFQLLSKN